MLLNGIQQHAVARQLKFFTMSVYSTFDLSCGSQPTHPMSPWLDQCLSISSRLQYMSRVLLCGWRPE
jgi:hypothetical protein